MSTIQLATRVDSIQAELFRETTKKLGTTPADALRMFIAAFNTCKGFPYDVRIGALEVEPFESEEETTSFATNLALGIINETR